MLLVTGIFLIYMQESPYLRSPTFMFLEDYFTPVQHESDEQQRYRLTLLIKFILISMFFAVGYFINTYFTGFVMARYTMAVVFFLYGIELYLLRGKWISQQLAANLYVFICGMIVFTLSFASGGIHSFVLPWISLIPILALLLVNSTAAWLWGGKGVVLVICFAMIDTDVFFPESLRMKQNDILIASLLIGLQFLMLILTIVFDRQQHRLIEELEVSRKQLQMQHQRVTQQNEQLEAEVARRTKTLVDYNQRLEQFSFMSSHNLRASTARLLGLGNLLQLPQTQSEELIIKQNMIKTAAELDHIIRDIASILDIEKGSIQHFSPINVSEEVNHILDRLQRDLDDAGIILEKSIEVKDTFSTIPAYFSSIIYNLISNAIKYRKPYGTPEVSLYVRQAQEWLTISVRDNGVGFNMDQAKEKIFKLYQRLHQHKEGKGIGLYLVKKQTELLGGSVSVESEPGIGTCFTVNIKGASAV